ncbi:hypothetical protein CPB84DRAFT_1828138 [Gymnopilus junonius]|uniref:Uncharacterized protein n=1 Tax=Gymnopilus junonius TaxID=109634 RepID=A0A9P5NFW0_GYMJU|nr:hypothetical protein CPB84DRAFT_1828138 [Gymnopilus junonius]
MWTECHLRVPNECLSPVNMYKRVMPRSFVSSQPATILYAGNDLTSFKLNKQSSRQLCNIVRMFRTKSICRWNDCGKLVTNNSEVEVERHLMDEHGVKLATRRFYCKWPDCPYNDLEHAFNTWDTIVRHIRHYHWKQWALSAGLEMGINHRPGKDELSDQLPGVVLGELASEGGTMSSRMMTASAQALRFRTNSRKFEYTRVGSDVDD